MVSPRSSLTVRGVSESRQVRIKLSQAAEVAGEEPDAYKSIRSKARGISFSYGGISVPASKNGDFGSWLWSR